jgi:hypothetical protein
VGVNGYVIKTVFPAYMHVPHEALDPLVSHLVAYGRTRRQAQEAVVIAYVLRGNRTPGLNQLPELNALAKRLVRKPR